MVIGDRIKEVRKKLGLTQEDFSKKIGTARNTIASYEINRREPMEATIRAICREFNVNYDWLKSGDGEMFDALPETLIDEVAVEYDLDDLDRRIMLSYLRLSESERSVIKKYIHGIIERQ